MKIAQFQIIPPQNFTNDDGRIFTNQQYFVLTKDGKLFGQVEGNEKWTEIKISENSIKKLYDETNSKK